MKVVSATFRVLAVVAGIALGLMAVRTQAHRDTCDHYKTELSAAVSDPMSTAPVLDVDHRTEAMIQAGRADYQRRTGEFAGSSVSDLAATWTRFADAATARGLEIRGC